MSSVTSCLVSLRSNIGDDVSDDDLTDLLDEINRIRTRKIAAGDLEGLEDAMLEGAEAIVRDVELGAQIERRNRLINIVVESRLHQAAMTTWRTYGDPSIGLEAAMVGVNRVFEGTRDSVDSRAKTLAANATGGFIAEMKAAGLWDKWRARSREGIFGPKDPTFEIAIAEEMWDLTLATPVGNPSGDADAAKIAAIIHRITRGMIATENRSGSYIRLAQRRVVRQMHNVERMRRAGADMEQAFQEWASFTRPLLDEQAMFEAGKADRDALIGEGDALAAEISDDIDQLRTLRGGAPDAVTREKIAKRSVRDLAARSDKKWRNLQKVEKQIEEVAREQRAVLRRRFDLDNTDDTRGDEIKRMRATERTIAESDALEARVEEVRSEVERVLGRRIALSEAEQRRINRLSDEDRLDLELATEKAEVEAELQSYRDERRRVTPTLNALKQGPALSAIRRLGFIAPESPLIGDLRALGVSKGLMLTLVRKDGRLRDIDNIGADEFRNESILEPEVDGDYVDRNWWLDQISKDLFDRQGRDRPLQREAQEMVNLAGVLDQMENQIADLVEIYDDTMVDFRVRRRVDETREQLKQARARGKVIEQGASLEQLTQRLEELRERAARIGARPSDAALARLRRQYAALERVIAAERAAGREQSVALTRLRKRKEELEQQRARAQSQHQAASLEADVRRKIDAEAEARGRARGARNAVDDPDAFMRSVFEAITTDTRLNKPENDIEHAFRGPGNIAKKRAVSRLLQFRSAADWYKYNERFGHGGLEEAIIAEWTRSAQTSALMQKFGTNPEAMLDRLRTRLMTDIRRDVTANPSRWDDRRLGYVQQRLGTGGVGAGGHRLDSQMAELTGAVNAPTGKTLLWGSVDAAAMMRAVRTLQIVTKLGMATISSMTDLANAATAYHHQGRNVFSAWMQALMAPLRGLTLGDQRRFTDAIGVGLDVALGDIAARWDAQDTVPGRTSKILSGFFKYSLLSFWTDALKRGFAATMMRDLGRFADLDLADLPVDLQRLLRMTGVTDAEWEIARQAVVILPNGKALLAPSEIKTRAVGGMLDGLSERERARALDEITTKIAGMIQDRVDFAVPTPGARERAIMRQGLQPGTLYGETARFIMQFKSFPITVVSKVQGNAIYGARGQSIEQAMANPGREHADLRVLTGQADLVGLAALIAGSTAMGLMALQAKELAKGREPRPLDRATIMAAFLQGGGAGIYGDFLFAQTNRFGGSIVESAAGPTAGSIGQAQRAVAMLFSDNPGDFWPETLRFVQTHIPGQNLFYIKAALDYLIWFRLQEAANPGYLERMEQRMRTQQSREFILPPSEVIG